MTSLLSGSVIIGTLLFTFSAAARTSVSPTNSLGKPVCDANGQPLVYSQKASEEIPIEPLISEKSLPSATPALELAPSLDEPAPFWGYGVFGSNIGLAGMLPVVSEHGAELIVSGSTTTFGLNNFWYVLSHDPVTGGYQQVHVQAPYGPTVYTGQIASMPLANVTGDASAELVVGLTDGRFFFYSTSTFEEVGTLKPVTSLTDFAATDLDGDGTVELIVLTSSNLRVFNPAGQLLWSLSGPGGSDLVVAQMDQDPALEIATTSGHVVDATTRSVQWTRSGGFGAKLRAAEIDGDQRAELIVADSWYYLTAYDVDTQLPKWSYQTAHDIGSIEIANVDSDPEVELLYGDGQWGKLHVMTLNSVTPVEEWNASNSEHGVQRITVADADGDGVAEILWTSGGSSTGRDRLEVLDTVTHQPEWESIHLDGPFLNPVVGDVTGDGVPELVTASSESGSGYSSGRILVFDSATLKLQGISQPIADNYSWTGLRDLKLRDVNGDGRLEIVVAADWLYDGLIEVYSFTDSRTFERKWTNNDRPDGAPFSQVDVLDVDNDGDLEIVAGNDTEHTGSNGNYVRVIDYATKAEEWRSPHLGSSWDGVQSLAIGDLDSDGHPEAVASVPDVGIAVMDLGLRLMEFTLEGNFPSVAVRPNRVGFVAGTEDGKVNHFTPNGAGSYEVTDSWTASATAITGLTPGDGDSLWVNTDQRISYWPNSTEPAWTSDKLGSAATGPVGLLDTAYGVEMFAGVSHATYGFQVVTHDIPTVTLSLSGSLAEGSLGAASLTFTRDEVALDSPLEVLFEIDGNAIPETDYTLEGATHFDGNLWKMEIPAGSQTASVTLRAIQDRLPEGTETLRVELSSTNGYLRGDVVTAATSLADDEPVVSVVANDATASEPLDKRTTDPGEFVFHRTGDLSRSLEVRFRMGGTATAGLDYGAIATRVIFAPGRDIAKVAIVPRADHQAEPAEQVEVQLIPSTNYLVDSGSNTANITLNDSEPVVSIIGAQTVKGGIALNLTRTRGGTQPLTVILVIFSTQPSGETTIDFQRVVFGKGAGSAQRVFRPKKKATQTVQISAELIDDGKFHLGASTSITFDLPPASSLR